MRTPARPRVREGVVVATLLLTAACGGPLDADDSPTSGADPVTGGNEAPETTLPDPPGPSALRDRANPSFPKPLIDLDDIISGGPPPDGIPPIDAPRFEPAADVDWLADADPVLSLTVGDETRGYPVAIMTWHEIVNDEVDGTPVTVTYCPLCNSGVAFLREVDGRVLDFGTSGLLYADNLVMYDRQTESLWPQLTGVASVGVLTGSRLEAIPMGIVGWEQFRASHPDATVLTRETGHDRDYGRNPYVGYDTPDGDLLVPLPEETDDRLPVKERVVGLGEGATALAVRRADVADRGVLDVEVDGRALTLWHLPGQASALDREGIADGQDVGTVAAFDPEVDGRRLTWSREGDAFVDDRTSSRWDITGRAVAGPLAGTRLTAVRHLDTFWFAWLAFQPETDLLDEEE